MTLEIILRVVFGMAEGRRLADIRPLVRVVEDGLVSPDRHIRFTVEGDPGDLPAEVATPLAVVLTELLQNAVEHGFPAPDEDAPPPEPSLTPPAPAGTCCPTSRPCRGSSTSAPRTGRPANR